MCPSSRNEFQHLISPVISTKTSSLIILIIIVNGKCLVVHLVCVCACVINVKCKK